MSSLLLVSVASASDLIIPAGGTKKVMIMGLDSTRSPVEKAGFEVEVVSSAGSIERGLAGRPELPESRGMLFVFRPESVYFWMRGMEFPLDILFFDTEGRLLSVHERLEPCDQCPLIKLPDSSSYALEINAGLSEKYGITPGDRLVIQK